MAEDIRRESVRIQTTAEEDQSVAVLRDRFITSPARYRSEVDLANADEWSRMLDAFEDANLYQTWGYGSVRWGESRLSHLVVRRDSLVVGLAQLLIVGLPYPRAGVAHLRWGPVCHRKGQPMETEVLHAMALALREEYVIRRRLFLRLYPMAHKDTPRGDAFEQAFAQFDTEEFRPGESYRTLIVDLRPPLEMIRKRLEQKWRNQLNRAERNELVIFEDDSPQGFQVFSGLYSEMAIRKKLAADSNVDEFSRIQRQLREGHRMKVLICECHGKAVAGLVGAGIGSTGVYLLGATSGEGKKSKGAYLLQWQMIQWLKQKGLSWYDLGGVNPETNPGVYHFKRGMSGVDLLYMQPRTLCRSALSRGLAHLIEVAKDWRRGRPSSTSTRVGEVE